MTSCTEPFTNWLKANQSIDQSINVDSGAVDRPKKTFGCDILQSYGMNYLVT